MHGNVPIASVLILRLCSFACLCCKALYNMRRGLADPKERSFTRKANIAGKMVRKGPKKKHLARKFQEHQDVFSCWLRRMFFHAVLRRFMNVIEKRRTLCPELGQIVRRYCVRIAVPWLQSHLQFSLQSTQPLLYGSCIGQASLKQVPFSELKVYRGILAEARRLSLLKVEEEKRTVATVRRPCRTHSKIFKKNP